MATEVANPIAATPAAGCLIFLRTLLPDAAFTPLFKKLFTADDAPAEVAALAAAVVAADTTAVATLGGATLRAALGSGLMAFSFFVSSIKPIDLPSAVKALGPTGFAGFGGPISFPHSDSAQGTWGLSRDGLSSLLAQSTGHLRSTDYLR